MADILITDAMCDEALRVWAEEVALGRLKGNEIWKRIYLAMNAARTMDDASDARLAKPALGEEAMIEVREALVHARDTFYRYAKLHQAKCTDEGDEKACANVSMGEEMSRALDAMNAARTTPIADGEGLVIDLEKTAFAMLIEAAGQSNWIPPDYYMNDWVSDCAEFLRTGQGLDAENRALRQIIADIGYCTPDASLEFMRLIPAEVKAASLPRGEEVRDELRATLGLK